MPFIIYSLLHIYNRTLKHITSKSIRFSFISQQDQNPYIRTMETVCGSINTAGLSACLQSGQIPPQTHLTYEGAFNELKYNVGPKTDKILDLHHGYARFQFSQSKVDNQLNDYLALFLKGNSNGQPRAKERKLNSVICLDISGSMANSLGNPYSSEPRKSRLSLCLQAIKMFISKLRPDDSVGMTTFDDKAHLIFDPILKKNIQASILQKIDSIKAYGQNDLMDGFNMSKAMLLRQMEKHETKDYQNRIIILSDVCDDSIYRGVKTIQMAAEEENIHLTIIGISTQFQSRSCQALKDTKGFNYFCATNENDILKYLFQTFDYTFFPSAHQVSISLQSDNVSHIQVFGTPDSNQKEFNLQQKEETTQGNTLLITQIKTVFPSQLEICKGQVFTVGGMILLKIQKKSKEPFFQGQIKMTYRDLKDNQYEQFYDLRYQFHPQKPFLSSESLREAIQGFIYTFQLKNILRKSHQMSSGNIYKQFYPMLLKLKSLCPKSKINDYKNLLKLIQSDKPPTGKAVKEYLKQMKNIGIVQTCKMI